MVPGAGVTAAGGGAGRYITLDNLISAGLVS